MSRGCRLPDSDRRGDASAPVSRSDFLRLGATGLVSVPYAFGGRLEERRLNEFIYLLRPTRVAMLEEGPTQTEASVLEGHVEHLTRLAEEGTVDLAGRTQTDDARTFGIVILRATDEVAARALMQADPAVSEGVMRAELFPFRVAISGPARTG